MKILKLKNMKQNIVIENHSNAVAEKANLRPYET
jgi:hypothetical protein